MLCAVLIINFVEDINVPDNQGCIILTPKRYTYKLSPFCILFRIAKCYLFHWARQKSSTRSPTSNVFPAWKQDDLPNHSASFLTEGRWMVLRFWTYSLLESKFFWKVFSFPVLRLSFESVARWLQRNIRDGLFLTQITDIYLWFFFYLILFHDCFIYLFFRKRKKFKVWMIHWHLT